MRTYALTGGASGIGAALAKALADQGHRIINVDIKDADIIADLSTPEGRQAAVAGVREMAPDGLDGLVPLAGVPGGGPPGTLITAVNFYGTVEFLEGLKDLLALKKGSVVLLCSNSGPMSSGEENLLHALLESNEEEALRIAKEEDDGMHYMVGKRALNYWMRRHCMAYAQMGIRMNAVAPGPVETPMTAPLLEDPVMAPVIESLLDATPLKRMGKPQEIAECILFLLGPQASYVCGSLLFIDGGFDSHSRTDHI
ncbi:SDR family oxidoreductase [Candidatus Litorirhabdus singularis]|nr:SDR family oxidoreductase [Candidatus Litorirhabdus singularis]